MLNNLQNHVESEESRWKSELRQQEYELVNLRLELKELQNKQASTHNVINTLFFYLFIYLYCYDEGKLHLHVNTHY